MKRKTTKTIAWILLAVCIFMTGRVLARSIETAINEEVNVESLFVTNIEDSSYLQGLGLSIYGELRFWLGSDNTTIHFLLEDEQFQYYAANEEKQITNSPELQKSYYELQKYMFVADAQKNGEDFQPNSTFEFLADGASRDETIYFAIPEDTIALLQDDWERDGATMTKEIVQGSLWLILSLAFMVYLIMVSGRKPEDTDLHLMPVDYWYTEILMILLTIIWLGFAALVAIGTRIVLSIDWMTMSSSAQNLYMGMLTAIFLLSIMLVLPLARKIKARRFLKDSLFLRAVKLCWQIIKNAVHGIKSFFDGSAYKEHLLTKRLFRSQLAYICSSAGMLLFFGLMSAISYSFMPMLLFVFFELLITAWYVMGNQKAYSDINAGYVESLTSQMKSENTKTALITNVSHDLKTPLTSIITYVDLLSKEEDLSETSRDYVNIIAGKAERLKHIVSDLFDLSKSVSGNIPMELDILDLKTLMEQTLADMKEPIEGSGHAIKVNLGQETVNIFSDGKKLYRVFQNVIDNALKYSLEGSRIFIDLKSSGNKVAVTIKNTAGYEMNFTEEDVLQRFTRGDESRTGEGSGLGLSIAESFTQSCGGTFKLQIDGDQFKVNVEFPTVEVTGRES
jgi:signal transduction histidine kinase